MHRFPSGLFTLATFVVFFVLFFLVTGILQSEVLRLVPPLEGSPVHVSLFFFCIGE